jgi:hypothetical protein
VDLARHRPLDIRESSVSTPSPSGSADTATATPARVWLVTGSSSGFGRSIVEAAVAAGDVVVATARRPDTLADLVSAHPDQVEALALDVTDTEAAAAVVDDVQARYGRVDVLVNNAGRGQVGAAEETTEAELRGLFDLHVFGPAALVRAVLPGMRARVLVVEPGAFRTGFSGAGLVQSAPIEAYADTVGPTRAMITRIDGTQPGDPARAAAAILAALDAERTPLRLPLGDDAVDGVLGHLDQVADEVRAWEHLARTTAYPTTPESIGSAG